MINPEFLSVQDLKPGTIHSCTGNRMAMFAKPKGLYGTTNSSGKMSSVISFLSNAVLIKNYAKAEVQLVERDVGNIHDTHQVTIQLSSPLDPSMDAVVNETHLVTTRYLSAFEDIRYEGLS